MSVIMNLFRNNIAEISAPTAGSIKKTSMVITGTVEWYKDNATWGVAYKKNLTSTWSYKTSSSKSIEVSLTDLTALTKYEIKLFVKYDGEYQYGPAIEVTTIASS